MKINAKDLCSIKDIQELKSVDSINNILKVINSEITPMSVTAQTYEELFSVIAVLKKQWNNFNSDVYFKNENVKMIYSLLYARPEVRNINIGYLSQRNSEQKYFKTGICKIFDSYENYSIRQWHKVIPIFSVFDYIPNLIDGIVNGKVNSLLELLPEDNKMVNRISIKNVQDLCTALEVSYQLDDKRKREKDALIEELKKNIKNTIAEFTKAHNEIDVNKETTMSSAFQYLDYTLKQKILTLYNENSDIVDEIVSKYSLPSVNENSIASFVKLRNNKTHSGTVEWGESAKIYTPLFAIVYASFFKYIKLPDEVIKSTLLQIF